MVIYLSLPADYPGVILRGFCFDNITQQLKKYYKNVTQCIFFVNFALSKVEVNVNRKEDVMKYFAMITGLMLMVLTINAQHLEEKDGMYYMGDQLYTGTYLTYYDNGNLKMESNYVEGQKHGDCKIYFSDGTLNEFRHYRNNEMDGTWITFNNLGVKVAEAAYVNGKKDGKWFIWDDEGNLKYELCYKDGEKTGTWKSYNEMGVVINERDYTEF